MTLKFRLTWIDDNPRRALSWVGGIAGNLRNTSVETDLEVIAVTEHLLDDLNNRVQAWKTSPPDLILLDHNFSTVPNRQFDLHGSAIAHLLRIQLPFVPIVCISGQNIDSDEFNFEDISEYTYLFDINKFHDDANLEQLFAIAKDFNLICFPIKQGIRQAMIDILQPPPIDRAALLNILPEEFEGTHLHGTSPHRIARWILNVLMKNQGFLYDSLEAATFIGLNEKAFLSKAKIIFENALYKGPFATELRPLWWSSSLTDVLFEVLPSYHGSSPQEAGRQIEGIDEADYSFCAMTGEHTPPPDVVAYTDSTKSDRKAVRHTFTIPVSDEAGATLGFSTRLRIRNDRRGLVR